MKKLIHGYWYFDTYKAKWFQYIGDEKTEILNKLVGMSQMFRLIIPS